MGVSGISLSGSGRGGAVSERDHGQANTAEVSLEPRVDPADVEARIKERDLRLAADDRSAAEKLLGDPPPSRSALGRPRKDPTGQP
jgi:hypothetical protein